MINHYKMFAAYNRWANDLLYDAVAKLGDEKIQQDCGAFFGSIAGTLNHILVGDTIWMSRFQETECDLKSLDTMIHENFDALRAARKAMDEQIIAYVDGLDEDMLAAEFTYQTIVNPETVSEPLSPALAHIFNHQTHHRGQVHGLLTMFKVDAPSLDLVYYRRAQAKG